MIGYLHNMKTLSLLKSFDDGILNALHETKSQILQEPDYKKIIPAANLRRMSKVIKMGVATGISTAKDFEIGAIIVGTGLGCFDNSIIFTREYHENKEGSLSPTAFTQSTDNTIAGQLALILQNNNYNITYAHKGLAFENALTDALLISHEENVNVLVGGLDENINFFEIPEECKNKNYWLGEGASFFILNQHAENSLAKILHCSTRSTGKTEEIIVDFLQTNQLEMPDLILYGNSFLNETDVEQDIKCAKVFNYSNTCGIYFTNSSFALHLATEIISNKSLAAEKGFEAENILIINNFYNSDLGLIYISGC